MSQDPNNHKDKSELRRRAEESLHAKGFLQGESPSQGEMAAEELLHLIHELQVHQIELEMQNEELHQAQEELAEARDRYFDLFDLAPVGYFMLDEDAVILDVNLAGAELLGVKRSELNGKTLTSFIYEQDQDIFYLLRKQVFRTHGQADGELRLVRTGGNLFYAQLKFAQVKEQSDRAGQLRLILRDITDRVLIEQQLVKNVAILSGAARIAHLGGWEWDIERDEVTLSEELQHIYGCEKGCYSMADFLLLAHPADRAAKREAIEKALAGDGSLSFEYRILRKNDQVERYLLASGEVVFNQTEKQQNGKPVKIYGASQDVTELKISERNLKSYAARLEALNRDLESFSYIASHDLQAPLRKILQFGELVKTHTSLQVDEEVKEYIDRMQRAAVRMQSLISDLLAYSRVTNNLLSYRVIDLNQIVREVLDDLEAQIQASGAQVEVGDLPSLSAEPILMRQLFQNLIGNALKFHAPGKSPVVKIEAAFPTLKWVEIRVIDQGIGFDEQNLNKIFLPFERLHNRSEYEGSGIGLAICRKIVERHSGSITARSKAGEGATFIVALPVQQE